MSQYTTELRYLVEQGYDLELNKYPIFDETYREVLNKKIVDEYYFREIGVETPARFKHHLNHTMDMIMPYYNQLYESELLKIDPLLAFRETEDLKRKTDTLNESDSTNTRGEAISTTGGVEGTQTQTQNMDRSKSGKVGEKLVTEGEATSISENDSTTTVSGDNTTTGHSSGTIENELVIDGTVITTTDGKETTTGDATDTKTEDKLSVTSDTPGGMLSVGDLKSHTWASSATMDDGTTINSNINNKSVIVDDTVTGTTDQTDTTTGTTTGEFSQTEIIGGSTIVEGSGNVTDTGSTTSTNQVTDNETEFTTNSGMLTDSKETQESTNKLGVDMGAIKGKVNTLDEYVKTKFGIGGHQANLLKEYRSTFLNIDKRIVEELSVLFMGVY